ncbi:MAG TPA: hypothetical protein VGO40_07100 [Longimicrobium sp.]|jgi:hypothetical protein|nr:hypothetical protein [Longimicrobium sp.]
MKIPVPIIDPITSIATGVDVLNGGAGLGFGGWEEGSATASP